jgi:hypothetical protein
MPLQNSISYNLMVYKSIKNWLIKENVILLLKAYSSFPDRTVINHWALIPPVGQEDDDAMVIAQLVTKESILLQRERGMKANAVTIEDLEMSNIIESELSSYLSNTIYQLFGKTIDFDPFRFVSKVFQVTPNTRNSSVESNLSLTNKCRNRFHPPSLYQNLSSWDKHNLQVASSQSQKREMHQHQ